MCGVCFDAGAFSPAPFLARRLNALTGPKTVVAHSLGNVLVELHPPPSYRLRIRTAPEDGYRSEYLCWRGTNRKLEDDSNYDENRCFCFRIRTRRDDRGRIVGAYYGKIYGDITFAYQFRPEFVPASVCMSYYLNPTPLDRNLEWDRKTNLGPDRVDYDLLP